MGASNLFLTRKKAFELRTKAIVSTYTVRVGGSDENHIKDRVITITDPTAAFRITVPDGVYKGQQLLITYLNDGNDKTVQVWKETLAAGINLTATGDYVSLEWVNNTASWVILSYQST